jgi:hypothetical protein
MEKKEEKEKDPLTCYLCAQEITSTSSVLTRLCRCKGSLGTVHTTCFKVYREHPSYTGFCTVCLDPFYDTMDLSWWLGKLHVATIFVTRMVIMGVCCHFSLRAMLIMSEMMRSLAFQMMSFPMIFLLTNLFVIVFQITDLRINHHRYLEEDHLFCYYIGALVYNITCVLASLFLFVPLRDIPPSFTTPVDDLESIMHEYPEIFSPHITNPSGNGTLSL